MKVVFDTTILISSTLWDWSVSQKLLHKMILADIPIFSSTEIVDEYIEVLQRDFDFTEEETKEKLAILLSFLTLVKPVEKIEAIKDDPDDNKIIDCAIASESDYIITYDTHLLALRAYPTRWRISFASQDFGGRQKKFLYSNRFFLSSA